MVNTDDAYGRRLAEGARIPVTTFSAEGDPAADWRAIDVRTGADGSTFRIVGPGGVEADASVALPGRYNVANALGAVVALVEAGVHLATAVAGVAACPGVPGRLERVEARPGFHSAGGLFSQARRGGSGAGRAAPGHRWPPVHRAGLRR